MTPYPMTLKEHRDRQIAAAARKDKRTAKGKLLWAGKPSRKARKALKPVDPLDAAFKRLWALCRVFASSRAKRRTGGLCEVGIKCCGRAVGLYAYHVFPSAQGNGIRYDVRNLLWACKNCNGAEYWARQMFTKREAYAPFEARHRQILGPLYDVLKALAGRKPMSKADAWEAGNVIKARIEAGKFEEAA